MEDDRTLRGEIQKASFQTIACIPRESGVVHSVSTTVEEPVLKLPTSEKLPFDILYQIFEYYAMTETFLHPLESLLLVCRFWHQAACGNPRLWTKFHIKTEHINVWCARVPLRLSRCPRSLLEIEITVDDIKDEESAETVNTQYTSLEVSLTGTHGEVAQRWRRFSAKDDSRIHRNIGTQSKLAGLLRFPTPNLEELYLEGLASSTPTLPLTPLLKTLKIKNNSLVSLPDLSTVVELGICITGVRDENDLAQAVNLVKLNILSGSFIHSLHSTHSSLKSLTLPGSIYFESINGFVAPNLEKLCTTFAWSHQFAGLLSCKGIPLQDLAEVQIGSEVLSKHAYSHRQEYLEALRRFLGVIENIHVLVFLDTFIAGVILKLLIGDCESLYQDRRLLLKLYNHEVHLEQGAGRVSSVRTLRDLEGGIPSPEVSWEEMFHSLLSDPKMRSFDSL